MDTDKDVLTARLVTMTTMLVLGVISLIFFAIYWFGCRRTRIPGVVLALPNSVQPNIVMSSPQNAAPNYIMVQGQNVQRPPYPAIRPVPNNHEAPYPVMAVNQQAGAQYPAGTVITREAPPSYSQAHQQMEEQAPLFKPYVK